MAYVGTPIDTRNQFQSLQGKRFNGDGSTTDFTLDVAPSSTLDIEVFVGNVRQDPNSAYTLSGTTLSFTGAPPSGTNNIYVVHQAKAVGTIDPPATESVAKTFSSAVTMSDTLTATTIATTGAVTATVDGTGLKSVGTNAQIHADASSGYGALITDGAASQSSYVFFQTNGTDKARLTADSSGNFEIGSGGTTTGLKVDSAGHVTMPLQSTFSAHRNGTDQSTSGGTDVSWTHERWDKNSDMGSISFTAPVTGTYLLIAQAKYAVTNGDGVHGIEIHTSNQNWYSTINSMAGNTDADIAHYSRQFSVLADMDASDTAKMHVNLSNRDLNGNVSYTWFSGALIC